MLDIEIAAEVYFGNITAKPNDYRRTLYQYTNNCKFYGF